MIWLNVADPDLNLPFNEIMVDIYPNESKITKDLKKLRPSEYSTTLA